MAFNNFQQIDWFWFGFFFSRQCHIPALLYTRKCVGREQKRYSSIALTCSSSIWATASGHAWSNSHMLNAHMRRKAIFPAWKVYQILSYGCSKGWLSKTDQVNIFRSRLIFS